MRTYAHGHKCIINACIYYTISNLSSQSPVNIFKIMRAIKIYMSHLQKVQKIQRRFFY